MSSEDEIQDIDRSEDIGDIIAKEIGAQLAVLLPEALKTVLPPLLNKELSQHSEVGESQAESSQQDQTPVGSLRLAISTEVANICNPTDRPTAVTTKLLRQAAKKVTKKGVDKVVFHPEPNKDQHWLHQAILNILSWKYETSQKKYVDEASLAALFKAIQALEASWRFEINTKYVMHITGAEKTARPSVSEAQRALERAKGDPFTAQEQLAEAADRRAAAAAAKKSASAMEAFNRAFRSTDSPVDHGGKFKRGGGRGNGDASPGLVQ